MKALGLLAAIAFALALQTTLARFFVSGTSTPDFVLVAVIAVALSTGPAGGMFAGSTAGLIQDVLSSGVIGIGGLAKSVVGFLVGAFGQQFIVTAALPRLVMFVAATALHALLFFGMYAGLGLMAYQFAWRPILVQALGNAIVGVVSFGLIESLPGMVERRRGRRVHR